MMYNFKSIMLLLFISKSFFLNSFKKYNFTSLVNKRLNMNYKKNWNKILNEYDDDNTYSAEMISSIIPYTKSIDSAIQNIVDTNANAILIGESSHGTREFYNFRNQLTKQLIEEGYESQYYK